MNTIPVLSRSAYPIGAWLRWSGLVASWGLLAGMVIMAAWGLMPFEAVPPQLHPLGWQRDLHHFFTHSGASTGLPLVIVAGSITLFAWGYRRARRDEYTTVRLIRHFTVANIVAVVAMLIGSAVVAFLPLHLAPPPGYGYAIKFIVKDAVVLLMLGWYQSRAVRRSRAIADS